MFSQFKSDKRFLNQYFLIIIGLFFVANSLLSFFGEPDWEVFFIFIPAFVLLSMPQIQLVALAWVYAVLICVFRLDFDIVYLALIPVAIITTFIVSAVFHSASHSSIQPRWLKRLIGETIGFWQLAAFPLWCIVHVLHHKYSDDTVRDPHPPMDKTYWNFMLNMRKSVASVFSGFYMDLWGKNEESLRNMKEMAIESKVATLLQVTFWFLLLGPQVFTFLFAFSIIFKMLHYAWFNYATHIYTPEGIQIVNLDHGLYKIVNFLAFGLYYHKNHHLRPDLFNPSKFADK